MKDLERTERMSTKQIQDRSAVLGEANTYAEVLFAALGALVASSRKNHTVIVRDGESFMQVDLVDTPSDYKGVMRVCGFIGETDVQDTMDKAYEKLKSMWREKYDALVHEMQVSAVANVLDEQREAAKVEEREQTPPEKQPDVPMFDAMCKIHGMIRDMMRQPGSKDCERTIQCDLIEFSLRVYWKDGQWRADFMYWDHNESTSAQEYKDLLRAVWWRICDVMGWMYE